MIATTAPKPGIYPQLDMAEYLALDAVGSSTLAHMARSAAYARHRQDESGDSTNATRSGSLLHAMVLEPAIVARSFVVGGKCEALLKSGPRKDRACGLSGLWYEVEEGHSRAYCGKHSKGIDAPLDPRECVSEAEWRTAALLAGHIHEHPICGKILSDAVGFEVSIVWQDDATGVLCKARPDIICPGYAADLKRNIAAHPERWPWEINKRGYHIQAAHYMAGLRKHGYDVTRWRWILADSTSPHEVWAPWCDEETLVIGEQDRAAAMAEYGSCLDNGYWPGYPTGDVETGLPDKMRDGAEGQVVGFSDSESDGD